MNLSTENEIVDYEYGVNSHKAWSQAKYVGDLVRIHLEQRKCQLR